MKKKIMTELEDFEADMLRLLMVSQRVWTIHKEFPNLTEKTQHGMFVRHIFREYTVINLVNFIKVRRDLTKNKDFEKLDDVLKPLVEPILKHENAIFQLRNQYIAHVQEDGRKFKVMINEIITKNNFPTNFGFYRYLAGLAGLYCGIVENNYKKVWDEALRKYTEIGGEGVSLNSGFDMDDVGKMLTDVAKPVEIKLFDEGFVPTLSKAQMELIKKSLEKK